MGILRNTPKTPKIPINPNLCSLTCLRQLLVASARHCQQAAIALALIATLLFALSSFLFPLLQHSFDPAEELVGHIP